MHCQGFGICLTDPSWCGVSAVDRLKLMPFKLGDANQLWYRDDKAYIRSRYNSTQRVLDMPGLTVAAVIPTFRKTRSALQLRCLSNLQFLDRPLKGGLMLHWCLSSVCDILVGLPF